MQNLEWKKCPGCLCTDKCSPRGLDGCPPRCPGRADEPTEELVGRGLAPAVNKEKEQK